VVTPYGGMGMMDVIVNYTSYDNAMRIGNEAGIDQLVMM